VPIINNLTPELLALKSHDIVHTKKSHDIVRRRNEQPLNGNKSWPSDHNWHAGAEGKRMSMVASDATCEAIDIRFPEATMSTIGWPQPQVSVALLASVNDVMTFTSLPERLGLARKISLHPARRCKTVQKRTIFVPHKPLHPSLRGRGLSIGALDSLNSSSPLHPRHR